MNMHQDDELNDLQWLLLEIERLDGCARTKGMVLEKIKTMAGRRLYLSKAVLVRPDQVAAARALIDGGYSVAQTRYRLIAAGHCKSVNVAYALIRLAIKQRGRELSDRLAKKQPDMFGVPHADT